MMAYPCLCKDPILRRDRDGFRCTSCAGIPLIKFEHEEEPAIEYGGDKVLSGASADRLILDDIFDKNDIDKRIYETLVKKSDPSIIIRNLLLHIGEDPDREGLLETPTRVAKAWKEWASGYGQDPAAVLKTFEDGADGVGELVIVHNIPVISKCEHHLADIVGHAHVGYIPKGRIVGLSKLARLVDIFGRRLQVQERLTNQVADALQEHLDPVGVGVLIRAHHGCMSTRGVKIHGSTTTTSAMRGVLLKEASARAEFLTLCDMAERNK